MLYDLISRWKNCLYISSEDKLICVLHIYNFFIELTARERTRLGKQNNKNILWIELAVPRFILFSGSEHFRWRFWFPFFWVYCMSLWLLIIFQTSVTVMVLAFMLPIALGLYRRILSSMLGCLVGIHVSNNSLYVLSSLLLSSLSLSNQLLNRDY